MMCLSRRSRKQEEETVTQLTVVFLAFMKYPPIKPKVRLNTGTDPHYLVNNKSVNCSAPGLQRNAVLQNNKFGSEV